MQYRVLKRIGSNSAFEPLSDKEATSDREKARTQARAWVQEASGRVAIVVTDRDRFSSTTTVTEKLED